MSAAASAAKARESVSHLGAAEEALEQVVDWLVGSAPAAQAYVDRLRRVYPDISNDELARKIVARKAFSNGLVGFAASLPGLPALPVTIPADLLLSWKIQAGLIVTVATVYGHAASRTDLKTDVYLIMAGNSAKEVLKNLGVRAVQKVSRRLVRRAVRRTLMDRLWKSVGRKIVSEAGQKTLERLIRFVPIVGGFVGYSCDWAATRWVGTQAIEYYRE